MMDRPSSYALSSSDLALTKFIETAIPILTFLAIVVCVLVLICCCTSVGKCCCTSVGKSDPADAPKPHKDALRKIVLTEYKNRIHYPPSPTTTLTTTTSTTTSSSVANLADKKIILSDQTKQSKQSNQESILLPSQEDDDDDKEDLELTCSVEQPKKRGRVLIVELTEETDEVEFGEIVSYILASSRPESTTTSTTMPLSKVVISVNCPGGEVSKYGLFYEHVLRLVNHKIQVHAVADRMACSGGYLAIACANVISAAPMSNIGSIGVVVEQPNIAGLCDKLGVQVETYAAGDHKRDATFFSKISEGGKLHIQQKLKETHVQFISIIQQWRPKVTVETTCDGSVFSGTQAMKLGLVDTTKTQAAILDRLDAKGYHVMWVQIKKTDKKDSDSLGLLGNGKRGILSWLLSKLVDYLLPKSQQVSSVMMDKFLLV